MKLTKMKTKLLILLLSLICLTGIAQKKLTLEDAMEIAIENSPEMKKAWLNMEQNKEYLNAQLAGLKSRFALNVSPFEYSKRDVYDDFTSQYYTSENMTSSGQLSISQPVKWTDGAITLINDFAYRDNYSEVGDEWVGWDNNLYLQINQPLFTYNRTSLNLKRNRLNLEVSTLNYSIQMLNMERQVNQYFYAIYQKQMAVQIAEEDFANQKVSKDIIESKVEGGLAAREELLQAELNYATSESNLQNAQVDLDNALDQFKKLLGLSLYDEVEVMADVEYKPVLIDIEKAIENGLAQRMELRQKDIDIEQANFSLIETSATNEFRGDVTLSIGLMGNDPDLMKVYNKPTNSPGVGVSFSIPIFDWGERKARIRAAELAVESTEIDKKSLEDDIILNIRQVNRNLQNFINQIGIAEQNEKNAQLTYDINLERYKNGDLTSMDLERFQNQLSQKKMDLANALINYKLELLNMKIQSLWDFENNTSFIPAELQSSISNN